MQKIQFIYKSKYNLLPTYLQGVIPGPVGERYDYNLRNFDNIIQVKTKKELFSQILHSVRFKIWEWLLCWCQMSIVITNSQS